MVQTTNQNMARHHLEDSATGEKGGFFCWWLSPTPLKKYEFINWDDGFPRYGKTNNVPNHQPERICLVWKWCNMIQFDNLSTDGHRPGFEPARMVNSPSISDHGWGKSWANSKAQFDLGELTHKVRGLQNPSCSPPKKNSVFPKTHHIWKVGSTKQSSPNKMYHQCWGWSHNVWLIVDT